MAFWAWPLETFLQVYSCQTHFVLQRSNGFGDWKSSSNDFFKIKMADLLRLFGRPSHDRHAYQLFIYFLTDVFVRVCMGVTCNRKCVSSQGWNIPRVTQLSRMAKMLMRSNQVAKRSRVTIAIQYWSRQRGRSGNNAVHNNQDKPAQYWSQQRGKNNNIVMTEPRLFLWAWSETTADGDDNHRTGNWSWLAIVWKRFLLFCDGEKVLDDKHEQ